MDLSELDKKYFIDPYIYNCPFCKRNNVSYTIEGHFEFDWTNEKKCHGYLVKCESEGCNKISLHWSWKEIREFVITNKLNNTGYCKDIFKNNYDIDRHLFYSRPTSSFTLDENIPKNIRDLLLESEQSLQANLLVGSSACLRKAIYELILYEKTSVKNEKSSRTDYPASLKKLKAKFKNVDDQLMNALSNIQELISDPLHEESWEAWDSKNLRFLIELTKAILDEMYVIPALRKKRVVELNKFKASFPKEKK